MRTIIAICKQLDSVQSLIALLLGIKFKQLASCDLICTSVLVQLMRRITPFWPSLVFVERWWSFRSYLRFSPRSYSPFIIFTASPIFNIIIGCSILLAIYRVRQFIAAPRNSEIANQGESVKKLPSVHLDEEFYSSDVLVTARSKHVERERERLYVSYAVRYWVASCWQCAFFLSTS